MYSHPAIVLCIMLMNAASSIGEDNLCASEQFVELRELGIIQCNFGSHYYGAFWYNTTEHRFEDPFLYYKNSVKSGRGFVSGEFDILPNGSLIINNVTLQHEHLFRVFMFLEEESDPTVQYDVNVKVVVKPEQDYPIIDKCEQGRRTCFIRANQIDLSCFVRDSRPAVALSWWIRTSTNEINISESYSVIRGEEWERSNANITYQFQNNLPLIVVVCMAVKIPLLLPINESMVLLEKSNYLIPSISTNHSYVLHRGNISLSCSNLEPTYLLWKKKISRTHYKDLAYFIFGDADSSRAFTDELRVAPHGALVISDILVKHEGVHVCLYEKDMNMGTVAYNLTVYSLPVPQHLLVTGCTNDDQCTIKIGSSGSLTCSVKKIRPYVTLQWRIVHEEDRDFITFSNHLIENTLVDDVYDVTLTSQFRVERTFRKNLTLECITTGLHSNFLHYQRGLSLVLLDTYDSNDTVTSSAADESIHQGRGYLIGIVIAAATVLVIVVLVIIWTVYKKHQAETTELSPEMELMTVVDSSENAVEGDTSQFSPNVTETVVDSSENAVEGDTSQLSPNVTERTDQLYSTGILVVDDLARMLRTKYKILWSDVRPVHVDQHEQFHVDELFCDNNMQFLKTKKLTGNKIWKKVDSYHDAFVSVKDTGTVVIIEGDVGYGKTMISLKLLQEWCERDKKSSLEGVEVVIFFQVNELKEFSSLYDAIHSVLLPKGSNNSSTDIEEVLRKCQSVVIILDDYEEIHQELVWLTDILKNKTLRHCKVVITTRSFEFVKYIVVSSKRFRLTAFSEETRKAYIYKYVGIHGKFVDKVKTELLENVVLNELCKIPLLLFGYIHMICEQNSNSEPVSSISIFRYLLECFELHHQNKQRYHADDSRLSETEALEHGKVIAQYLSTVQDEQETDYYGDYKRLGIFRHPISTESKEAVQGTILAEWYAGKNTKNMNKTELEHVVKLLNLNQICFLPLFASYFNEQFFDIFINCQRDIGISATWLKYELNRKLSTIRSSLTKFCAEHVDITTCEYPLLQRSKIEMLKLASRNKIPIEDVSFANCVDVEMSTKDMLIITSGMEIPVLETVKNITFDGKQTKIKTEEAKIMLMYCSQCEHLETVQFRRLIMPWSMKHCTNVLRKNIKVRWEFSDVKEYELQMDSGLWKDLQHNNILRKKRYQSMTLKSKFGKSPNELDEVDTVADAGSPMND